MALPVASTPDSTEGLCFLQDTRRFVGNSMVFKASGRGYTCDLTRAKRFSPEAAAKQRKRLPTADLRAWPVDYLLARDSHHVDFRTVSLEAAGEGAEGAYFLQDTRSLVGNSMSFWALGGGYTCDFTRAERFTRQKAFRQHASRATDQPWPAAYIEGHDAHHVDFQRCERKAAIEVAQAA
jgi:hypothetical protein